MEEPAPGFMDDGWVFECWTGPSMKWVPYADSTQAQLRDAYNHNRGVQAVMVNDTRMEVSVAPGDMFQNNPETSAKARKVRLAPKGGWPE